MALAVLPLVVLLLENCGGRASRESELGKIPTVSADQA